MTRVLYHPEREQIVLTGVLDALSDPIRLGIVLQLAGCGEQSCSSFTGQASKPNLTYHLARLREAGLTRTRIEGAYRYMSLRRDDLDARFPGLLQAVLSAAAASAGGGRPSKARDRAPSDRGTRRT
jgi:DNA-binding transcriptional ArsR family regulator